MRAFAPTTPHDSNHMEKLVRQGPFCKTEICATCPLAPLARSLLQKHAFTSGHRRTDVHCTGLALRRANRPDNCISGRRRRQTRLVLDERLAVVDRRCCRLNVAADQLARLAQARKGPARARRSMSARRPHPLPCLPLLSPSVPTDLDVPDVARVLGDGAVARKLSHAGGAQDRLACPRALVPVHLVDLLLGLDVWGRKRRRGANTTRPRMSCARRRVRGHTAPLRTHRRQSRWRRGSGRCRPRGPAAAG